MKKHYHRGAAYIFQKMEAPGSTSKINCMTGRQILGLGSVSIDGDYTIISAEGIMIERLPISLLENSGNWIQQTKLIAK